jgi:hypothetical protein
MMLNFLYRVIYTATINFNLLSNLAKSLYNTRIMWVIVKLTVFPVIVYQIIEI